MSKIFKYKDRFSPPSENSKAVQENTCIRVIQTLQKSGVWRQRKKIYIKWKKWQEKLQMKSLTDPVSYLCHLVSFCLVALEMAK